MDDVVLVSHDPEEIQEMLNITNEIAGRYHIEFGKEKSKVLKIGKKKTRPKFRLGDLELEYTEKYKYLGLTLNSSNNLKDHLMSTKGKTEAALQTILSIAGDKTFKNIEMGTIWESI